MSAAQAAGWVMLLIWVAFWVTAISYAVNDETPETPMDAARATKLFGLLSCNAVWLVAAVWLLVGWR